MGAQLYDPNDCEMEMPLLKTLYLIEATLIHQKWAIIIDNVWALISSSDQLPTSSKSLDAYNIRWRRTLPLSFITVLPCILDGFVEGYPTLAIPQMNLTVVEASWFGSISFFATPIGSITTCVLVDAVGRKAALLYGIAPHLIGWLLLAGNYNLTATLAGRFFTGFTEGSLFYPAQVYAAECLTVRNNRLRSSLATWNGVTNALGLFAIVALSYLFDYRLISAFAAVTSLLVFAIIWLTIPESPTWLRLQGRDGDADVSIRRLGIGRPLLRSDGCSSGSAVQRRRFSWSGCWASVRRLADRDVYRPVSVLSAAYVVIPFCGAPAVLTYMVDIIGPDPKAAGDRVDRLSYAYKMSVVSALLTLVAHTLTVFVQPLIGVKRLAVPAGVCIAAAYVLLGYAMAGDQANASLFEWRSVALCVVVFMYHLGMETAPLAFMEDSFPADAKRFACVPIVTSSVATGLVTKVHPFLVAGLGGRLYFVYAAVELLGVLFVAFCFDETVGKTVKDIREERGDDERGFQATDRSDRR